MCHLCVVVSDFWWGRFHLNRLLISFLFSSFELMSLVFQIKVRCLLSLSFSFYRIVCGFFVSTPLFYRYTFEYVNVESHFLLAILTWIFEFDFFVVLPFIGLFRQTNSKANILALSNYSYKIYTHADQCANRIAKEPVPIWSVIVVWRLVCFAVVVVCMCVFFSPQYSFHSLKPFWAPCLSCIQLHYDCVRIDAYHRNRYIVCV